MPVKMKWFDPDDEINRRSTLALRRAAAFAAGAVRQEITAQDLIDTGTLLNSIEDRLVSPDRARVATNVFYSIYLEYGAAGRPANAFMRRGMEREATAIARVIHATMKAG